MSTILVSGLINIETTLQIESFPVEYQPATYPFFGVNSTVSGVGYNIAKALTALGDRVQFGSLIGADLAGKLVLEALKQDNIPETWILQNLGQTAQSVILFDHNGKRAINVDLKNMQETPYPVGFTNSLIARCDLAVLCNINFSRPLLAKVQQAGIPVVTDVHSISDIEDDYNRDFMQYADILFMSHERLPCPPEEWAIELQERYGTEIIVIGLGERGALLSVKSENFMSLVPAVQTRPILNTIGAGDALLSAFVHCYVKRESPLIALQKAVIFASHKIGERSAAAGFLTESQLNAYYEDGLGH